MVGRDEVDLRKHNLRNINREITSIQLLIVFSVMMQISRDVTNAHCFLENTETSNVCFNYVSPEVKEKFKEIKINVQEEKDSFEVEITRSIETIMEEISKRKVANNSTENFTQVLIKKRRKEVCFVADTSEKCNYKYEENQQMKHHINKVSTERGRKYSYNKCVRKDIKSDTYHDTIYLPPTNQSNANAMCCNEQYCDMWKDKNGSNCSEKDVKEKCTVGSNPLEFLNIVNGKKFLFTESNLRYSYVKVSDDCQKSESKWDNSWEGGKVERWKVNIVECGNYITVDGEIKPYFISRNCRGDNWRDDRHFKVYMNLPIMGNPTKGNPKVYNYYVQISPDFCKHVYYKKFKLKNANLLENKNSSYEILTIGEPVNMNNGKAELVHCRGEERVPLPQGVSSSLSISHTVFAK
ncbi:serine repeat antigen 1 (SERA1) [Plasmodium ovale curtisi]|uniref:Serine repeat antigen 1 (SERA1) n=1 Tax=Plasmodium ovale curtisi TaxID=864141 RepID=A0A1A8VQ32_PLAOA|nr:serine repeat antigen 1 (SERA1) [Plasmodium ovale curtisi]